MREKVVENVRVQTRSRKRDSAGVVEKATEKEEWYRKPAHNNHMHIDIGRDIDVLTYRYRYRYRYRC